MQISRHDIEELTVRIAPHRMKFGFDENPGILPNCPSDYRTATMLDNVLIDEREAHIILSTLKRLIDIGVDTPFFHLGQIWRATGMFGGDMRCVSDGGNVTYLSSCWKVFVHSPTPPGFDPPFSGGS